MNAADRKLLMKAATMIDEEAQVLLESHTINGKWPVEEAATERVYREMVTTAMLVIAIANRRKSETNAATLRRISNERK